MDYVSDHAAFELNFPGPSFQAFDHVKMGFLRTPTGLHALGALIIVVSTLSQVGNCSMLA